MAAMVGRACALCDAVRSRSSFVSTKRDSTPVTLADFAAQMLVSLELRRAFGGSVRLLSEEDVSYLEDEALREAVCSTVREFAPPSLRELADTDMLARAAEVSISSGESSPPPPGSSGWFVLDPIDGTRGFTRTEGGGDSQYAIGLAFVDKGKGPTAGAIGLPNWRWPIAIAVDSGAARPTLFSPRAGGVIAWCDLHWARGGGEKAVCT